jgi:uncharacterized protein YidB (DUF937 family)
MLDNLIQLVKENAGEAIINNPAIPNEKNEEAINTTASSIFDTLKAQLSGGNMDSISNLFNPSTSNDDMASKIGSNLSQTLQQKFGLDSQKSGAIISSIIPQVLNKLVHKTNDANDSSFDISSILGSLGGSGNVSDLLSKFTGGNKSNEDGIGGLLGKLF